MKAIVCPRFGPPEVLHLAEVERPAPKDDEVLVRVYAAAVNPLDSFSVRGSGAGGGGGKKRKTILAGR